MLRIKTALAVTMVMGFLILPWACEQTKYEIQITPRGQDFERKLTISTFDVEGGPGEEPRQVFHEVTEESLKPLIKVYEEHGRGKNKNIHVFKGVFREKIPNDIGGAGEYTCFQTSLGTAYVYVERIRGREDQAALLEADFDRANRLVNILLGWAEFELKGQRGYEKLREFLDKDFRNDIKNFVFYAYTANSGSEIGGKIHEDSMLILFRPTFVRVCQYLIERGYFALAEIPTTYRALNEIHDSPEKILRWLQRLVANRMGIGRDEPIPASLDFLSSSEKIQKSLEEYYKTTPEYKQNIEKSKKEPATQPAETQPSQPEPFENEFGLIGDMTLLSLGIDRDSADKLKVELATHTKPLKTNGLWDEKTGMVTWNTDIGSSDPSAKNWPDLFYATWVIPNQEIQKSRFGKQVLDGVELMEYCIWWSSLNQKEAAEWDAMIATLRPGPESLKKLETFRFSDEPAVKEGEDLPGSYAYYGARLILEPLSEKPTSHPASEPTTGTSP